MQQHGGDAQWKVTLKRKPFFLYPQGRHEISKWGDRLDALYPGGRKSIAKLGASAGYSFNFDAPLSDTLDSHRLYLWAEKQGHGEDLAQCIGHEYFEKARPLADREMLCACAAEVGLDAAAAQSYLESEAGHAEVRQSVEHNARLGIRAIPVFVFRSGATFETVVHGSADTTRFGEVLEAIAQHHATNAPDAAVSHDEL